MLLSSVKTLPHLLHIAPSFSNIESLRRLQLIPKDGGSWADLRNHPQAEDILTPAMLRYIAQGKTQSNLHFQRIHVVKSTCHEDYKSTDYK